MTQEEKTERREAKTKELFRRAYDVLAETAASFKGDCVYGQIISDHAKEEIGRSLVNLFEALYDACRMGIAEEQENARADAEALQSAVQALEASEASGK